MSQLQRVAGGGENTQADAKTDVSDLASAAQRARAALDAADADLAAKVAALRVAMRGPPKTERKTSVGQERSRSFFDNPGGDFCSC